ncbi:MAG: hydrogenase small subunit [Candidatus Omnitrophica bacterium]|nr:hydrogenase small subunit [Candidatus Omnitrophota bacterium]
MTTKENNSNPPTVKEIPAIWLPGAGCTGCSVSVLNAVSPKIKNLLLDEIVPGTKVSLLFHATIMAGQGEMVIEVLKDTQKRKKGKYLLIVEGSIPTAEKGKYGTLGNLKGKHETILGSLKELGSNALAVIALGACSSYGGIPAAHPNPTGCKGVKEVFKENSIETPVINVPGCPPHPDWLLGTISSLLLGRMPELDDVGRPKLFYGTLIHENCPRRADFDKGKFAKYPGDEGCLYQVGCKGHYTYADCALRQWNNGVNWCIKAGSPCLGCVEPEFPDLTSPFYEKITTEDIKSCITTNTQSTR